MKKTLLVVAAVCGASVMMNAEEYVTSGTKQSLTFTKLSEIEASGVKKTGNTFEITKDIKIAETDTLTLENNAVLKLGDKVQILIEGVGNFAPADTATIAGLSADVKAKGLRFSGENAKGSVKHILFETTALLSYAKNGITVENCTFDKANGGMNSTGAVSFGPSVNNVVRNCRFTECTVPAIGSGANITAGVIVEDCYLFDNNTINANKPQINLTTPGENGPTIIRNNKVIGNKRLKVGGISVANMLGLAIGDVVVYGNEIRDHRYGMQLMGGMNVVVKNNKFIDNRYESNPMNGGSALSITDQTDKLSVVLTGNLFQGSIWGITAIGQKNGFKNVNLGKVEDPNAADYNPGNNVFKDNGNFENQYDPTHPYDLYNNSAKTIYAQGNFWSVKEQTKDEIEKVIFHKNDNSALGEVIFMPVGNAGVGSVKADGGVYYDGRTMSIVSDEEVILAELYTMQGAKAASFAGEKIIDVSDMAGGLYIAVVKTESGVKTIKFVK